jgi:hypothetical protein
MDKETRELLAKLFTSQLKKLAEEKGIDCGEDPDRIDYLSVLGKSDLITREDVERHIGETESEKKEEVKDEEYLGEIENIIKEFRTGKPLFNKADDLIQRMQRNFEEGNLEGTISQGISKPGLIVDVASNYERVRRAYIIYAFRQLISDVRNSGIDIGEGETLISKALDLFRRDEKEELDETLAEISEEAKSLNREQAKKIKESILTVEEFIDSARDLGADIKEARDFFRKAEQAFDSKTYNKVDLFLKKARDAAEEARSDRIQGISDSLLFVRSILKDARDIGADVGEAERIFKDAESAFERENYRECKALIKEVEQLALELQDTQIKKAMKLRRKREPEDDLIGSPRGVVEVEPEVVPTPQRRFAPAAAKPAKRRYPQAAGRPSPRGSQAMPAKSRMRKTRCPNCGQNFPVKGGKGPIKIECPFCGNEPPH